MGLESCWVSDMSDRNQILPFWRMSTLKSAANLQIDFVVSPNEMYLLGSIFHLIVGQGVCSCEEYLQKLKFVSSTTERSGLNYILY